MNALPRLVPSTPEQLYVWVCIFLCLFYFFITGNTHANIHLLLSLIFKATPFPQYRHYLLYLPIFIPVSSPQLSRFSQGFLTFGIFFFFFFFLLRPYLQHMEVPRLEVKSELQLLTYATATQDPSHVCDLCHRSQQLQILNPLSQARNRTNTLMETILGS